jgi:wyosine [tRNA(Phe)-imidazoG37] synthetase (radical SAM superfamily)
MPAQTFPLSRGIAYGPVRSRRLGYSLGINLFPEGHKICPFDCVYCEYGCTTDRATTVDRDRVPPPSEVLQSVASALREHPLLEYVTFSGHGEPTLHPEFPEIVDGVLGLRDQLQPQARVAVLSCSGVVGRPGIRSALSRVDERIMKLDAGDETTFQAINRPAPGLSLEGIIEGLSALRDIVIQHMILDGAVSNSSGESHQAWVRAVARIGPREIQIYSVERPTAEAGVHKVPLEVLQRLARDVQNRLRIPAEAF